MMASSRSILAAAALVLSTCAVGAAQSLDDKLSAMLRGGRLAGSGCQIGVMVIDPDTGAELASANSDAMLIPASNMKLFTSGAALMTLGPDFTFETQLVYDEEANRVVVVGSGDPAFGDPKLLHQMELGVDELLARWTHALRNAGVETGAELVIDDRVFDREFVHPTWPIGQLNRWYCAEVAGLNFHTNYLTVFTDPQAPGAPPVVNIEPDASWVEISNKAKSVSKGQHTAWAARKHGTNNITLHGDIRFASDPVEVTLSENPRFFASLLEQTMRRADMAPSSSRVADLDDDLSGGKTVHVVRTPLSTVLERCNIDSYNLYAECLLKRIGYDTTLTPGSWKIGAAIMRRHLQERLGPSSGRDIIVADGSGMSRENKVTPEMTARWLAAFHNDTELGGAFKASLPRAGLDGTLKKRFKKKLPRNEVRAKSGYLSGVSALSGYVSDPESGKTLVFCVITNEKPNRIPLTWVREFEEEVVHICDEWVTEKSSQTRVQHGG